MGLKGLNQHPLMLMMLAGADLGGRCGPEGLERAPTDAHDAGCLALEMSAPGADLGSAKRRGDVGLKGLNEHPLMLMMLAVWRWKCQRQVLIWGQQSAGEMWA